MKQVKKVKRNRRILFTVLIVAIVLCAGAIGYLWYTSQSRSSQYEKELNTLKQEYSDYTTMVENTALPAGWSEATLSSLKEKALAAYDTSEIEIYQKAVDGDSEAEKSIQDGKVSTTQPETVQAYATILENLDQYPENLAQLAAKDDRLLTFVIDYPKHKDANISETDLPVLEGDMTLMSSLKAADPRWGYLPFGDGLFAQNGSAETALSMVFSHLLNDPEFSPAYFAMWAKEYGYEDQPVKEEDSIFSGAAYMYGVNYTPLPGYATYINDSLNQGSTVIAEVKAADGSDKTDFIVIPIFDENGNWVVYDPLSSELKESVAPDSLGDRLVNVYAFWS